jgi:hypothetical protein
MAFGKVTNSKSGSMNQKAAAKTIKKATAKRGKKR